MGLDTTARGLEASGSERRFVRLPASAYLSTLLAGMVLGLWSGYLWPNLPIFKSQAPAVLVPLAAFAFAVALWALTPRRRSAHRWALAFLIVLSVAWVVNLSLFLVHGDLFTHVSWLFAPIMVMIGLRPPSTDEGMTALRAFAWTVSMAIAATFALEKFGLLAPKYQLPGIITFDEAYYWLPINDALGIDGRWPGPFGHNGYTAMMGAFLIVIAVASWSRANWVFLVVGVFALIVTSGRASAGAAVAGLVVIAMFTTTEPLARVARWLRLSIGAVLLIFGALFMFSGRSGLTGRQDIWPAFLDLWQTSPWIGVGTSGISVSGGITQEYGHAHSLFLDLLARYGFVAFSVVMVALAIGVAIALAAAIRGLPGPLAVLVAYLVTAVTEPRNDWAGPNVYILLITVCVMTAAAFEPHHRRCHQNLLRTASSSSPQMDSKSPN